MQQNLEKLCKKASEIIKSYPKKTKIRVVSHYDADGITAAAIICKALYRQGYNFHVTLMRNPFDKGLEKVSKEDNKLIIFTDMGSGQIKTIEQLKSKIIIIDHHQYLKKQTTENILQINANLCQINGNYEACGSTLTLQLAKTLNPENIDLTPLAITGAIGDKQYIGGFQGFNKKIIEQAINKQLISQEIEIKLEGENIEEALYYSVEPYYSELSGDKNKINKLLEKLKIDKNTKINQLTKDQKKQLQSYLMLKLIKKGFEKNILDTIIQPRYKSDKYKYKLDSLADLIDSCGKGGNRSLGLALCMGDQKSFEKAIKLEKQYKQKLLDELIKLEQNGLKQKKSFRYFYSDESSLGGVIAGIAANFIFDNKKPLISIVKKDNELHISCRGNQKLVKNGLDLGEAMKKVAEELNGNGGGHKIASGATIKQEHEKKFLNLTDETISKQLKI